MLLELHYLASVPDHTIDMPRPNLESTAVPALTEQNDVFDSNFSDLYVPEHTPETDLPVENSQTTLSFKVLYG